MEEIKIFKKNKIKIRKLSKKDLKRVKMFQEYINSLIEEEAQLSFNKKISLKEEREFLNKKLKEIKNSKGVFLLAESNNMIIGNTSISLSEGRRNHVGGFGITIRNGYRELGLGKYLTKKILELAKKELKPRPKIIRLSVFATNKIAISLYNKVGFKRVACVPNQVNYKNKLEDEIIMIHYL